MWIAAAVVIWAVLTILIWMLLYAHGQRESGAGGDR